VARALLETFRRPLALQPHRGHEPDYVPVSSRSEWHQGGSMDAHVLGIVICLALAMSFALLPRQFGD